MAEQVADFRCASINGHPKRPAALVVTDGFYEWQKLDGGAKQPYRIVMKDREPFGLAGLWGRWRPAPEAEPVETFASPRSSQPRADYRVIAHRRA